MIILLKWLSYLKVMKREILLKSILGVGISGLYIVQALVMTRILDGLLAGSAFRQLAMLIALVLLVMVLRGILLLANEIYAKTIAVRVKDKLRNILLDQIFRLGPSYVNYNRSGMLTSLLTDGIESLEAFFVNYIPQVCTVLLSGTFIVAYLWRMDAVSSGILLVAMLLCIAVPMVTVPLIQRHVTSYWERYAILTSQYIDNIQGMTTLKTLDAEAEKSKELKGDATHFYEESIRNTGIGLLDSSLMLVLTAITSSVPVIVSAVRGYQGLVPLAAVSACLFLTVECARILMDLNRYWHSCFLGLSVARDLFTLMEREPDVKDMAEQAESKQSFATQNQAPQAGTTCPPAIKLDQISFSYPSGFEAIKQVSMSIEPGQTVALVGMSGCGKSTILSLLMRFYDVQKGQIHMDGQPITQMGLEELRKQIAVVFQDTFLFYGTIKDNILMARPDAGMDEIVAAAKAAQAHDYIMEFPDGYDTLVGEKGVTLSGGQRQRLSIARAFLKNAPVLLLDEATSSVDGLSEVRLMESLKGLAKGKTTIIVAHRLSTIKDADQIFVMKEGRLVEQGNHDELQQLGGVYSGLIRAQEEEA